MMTSPIGKGRPASYQPAQEKKRQAAFTLIEVLLCVTIFAVGLTAIYQTLAVSWAALHYARMYAEADRLIEEKSWSLQTEAWENSKVPVPESGTLLGTNQTYAYKLQTVPAGGSDELYQVRLSISRISAREDRSVTRDFYVLLPPAKP